MKFPRFAILILIFCLLCLSCDKRDQQIQITLWHQMMVGERAVLEEQVERFEQANPGIRVRTLYKETEELRSGFQAAALAGTGPELIFGPSDSLGAFVTMGIVQDMRPWYDESARQQLVDKAFTWLPLPGSASDPGLVQIGDRIGNHLALVYNRNLVPQPPQTTDQMIEMATAATIDENSDGRTDQYGLVWNFVEPFFLIPFITGHGGWIFDQQIPTQPSLDTPQCAAALQFVAELQNRHQVMPANCDYETADALFKSGKAAMIINGDWSWGEYLTNEQIDAAIAPLPIVSSTNLPMGPMVATKGYSLSASARGNTAQAAMKLVHFMTSVEVQREFMIRLKTLPSQKQLFDDPALRADPTLTVSLLQMTNGKPMPVIAEMRAVWDAMRPSYQSLLGGDVTPTEAVRQMQQQAESKIRIMNQQIKPDATVLWLQIITLVLTVTVVFFSRSAFSRFITDWKNNWLAYCLIAPAMLITLLTIIYPFIYNVILSFSNMSLRHFQDWQVTGLQNYRQVFTEQTFFYVLLKTVVWTAVNVFFHVAIGLLLAVILNGPVRGKAIYRVLLILPWAIPAYITALSWRGMFDYEYGAVNLIANQLLGLPTVNWLGEETWAFVACIITNVWLGFPFMMVIALGGMQGIPREMYEAANIDRVSRWKQFWHITVPMLRPVLLPAITLGAIWTFNNLNVVWLVSNGGEPADKTHILVSYVYEAVFNLYQYGYGAALSMIIFAILLVFSLLFLGRTNATESIT